MNEELIFIMNVPRGTINFSQLEYIQHQNYKIFVD